MSARLAAFADPGPVLIASARHRRGCGETVPPFSAAGSGGPLSPGTPARLVAAGARKERTEWPDIAFAAA